MSKFSCQLNLEVVIANQRSIPLPASLYEIQSILSQFRLAKLINLPNVTTVAVAAVSARAAVFVAKHPHVVKQPNVAEEPNVAVHPNVAEALVPSILLRE